MDKYLKPERFEADPCASSDQSNIWIHWKATFDNFVQALETKEKVSNDSKYQLLANYISPSLYTHIKDTKQYDVAIQKLNALFLKPVNEIYARYQLAKRQQQPGESIDQYIQTLKLLSKECHFQSVTAEQNENDNIRDAFISGLSSSAIRQRLLENCTLTLDKAYEQARSLEMAQIQNDNYRRDPTPIINSATIDKKRNELCYFCGNRRHPRRECPAFNTNCAKCGKKGHFSKVCLSKGPQVAASETFEEEHATHAASTSSYLSCILSAADLKKATVPVVINGQTTARALIDTGSTGSFIDQRLVNICNLRISPCTQRITMAQTNLCTQVNGSCKIKLKIQDQNIEVTLMIMEELCSDIILGHDVLQNHQSLEMKFGGSQPPLKLCVLSEANIKPVSLFTNLIPFAKPIAMKSRRHSEQDEIFIKDEIQKLLCDKIIEPSRSPWRAQVLITSNEHHKKRMVIDYSQTINKYTELDAYPLPSIDGLVSKVAKHKIFSKIDLRSAYHQVPILEHEKQYTAFEACGNLYQFRRIPFGVTNGVAAFQRAINTIIEKEHLQGVYAYLDDITICGHNKAEHDERLRSFQEIATRYNLTLNLEKSEFSKTEINLLGYNISNNVIKPDPERLRPLLEMPVPGNTASLRRTMGVFAHYSKWIPKFSDKIKPLAKSGKFPLSPEAIQAFQSLKSEIANSAINVIDPNIQLTVETDASDHAIAATLTQEGRPVAFFSRTLSPPERNHSAIEKEAAAIVESIRKWRQFLMGKTFQLITDQKSVAFMFDQKHNSKIKNDKIQRWRLELSNYNFDITYRPGKENVVADALSRANLTASVQSSNDNLLQLHKNLSHPGITRMVHWIRAKHLPYSVEDIRRITNSCDVCAEIKPRFLRTRGKLIKATAPFERISIDFKGPLPCNTGNRYMLTIIDEYSRFPFAYPCSDLSSETVKKKLTDLFAVFGIPSYVHSDRGTAFVSADLKDFLHGIGVATSYTTPYNPQGNGQTERYNGIIWKTVQLSLKTLNLPISRWETVLSQSLHAIRSLLCTATGCTPHERMFTHPRRSTNGQSMPTWLTEAGKAFLRNSVRKSKYDPIVEEVEVIEANPMHSHIRLQNGRELIVSNRHLAPTGNPHSDSEDHDQNADSSWMSTESNEPEVPNESNNGPATPRRSSRERNPPAYLQDYETS